jgi:ABC-2 type transport system permease protein
VPLLLVLALSSVSLMLSSSIIFQSLAFWLGPVETFARQLMEFVITFSIYPHTIYPFYLRVVLFTAIPAGFVSFLPVTVLQKFDAITLLQILAAAVVYAFLAVKIFYLGLRRYESGNRFGARA